MDSLSLSSSKANLTKSAMPKNKEKFEGKGKKNLKVNYHK